MLMKCACFYCIKFVQETLSPPAHGTNVGTVTAAGTLTQLTREMDRYRWRLLGLSQMRWNNFGKTLTEEGPRSTSVAKRTIVNMAAGFNVTPEGGFCFVQTDVLDVTQ